VEAILERKLRIESIPNLLFSKYDVDIYIDDVEITTIEHGQTGSIEVEINEGNHTLRITKEDDNTVDGNVGFSIPEENALHYKLSLSKDQIEIEKVEEQVTTSEKPSSEIAESEDISNEETKPISESGEEIVEEPLDLILTAENSEDLAAILSTNNESDPLIKVFAEKYKGRTIEFSGNVTYMTNYDEYTTRYDILLGSGDYDENRQKGPNFKFKNVSAYDLGLDTLFLEDVIEIGKNVQVLAIVGEYNEANTLFLLEPISIIER